MSRWWERALDALAGAVLGPGAAGGFIARRRMGAVDYRPLAEELINLQVAVDTTARLLGVHPSTDPHNTLYRIRVAVLEERARRRP